MTASLTVHNAEITTATVQIQTLTISGKQVTLAVFRQLPEDVVRHPLISGGTFNGIPWGRVNYHPDKCGGSDHRRHVHVVWQDGDTLRRDRIEEPSFGGPYYSDFCDAVLEADIDWSPWGNFQSLPDYAEVVNVYLGDVTFFVTVDGRRHKCLANRPTSRTLDEIDRLRAERNENLAALEQEIREERVRIANVLDRWSELQALPQLYIAV